MKISQLNKEAGNIYPLFTKYVTKR